MSRKEKKINVIMHLVDTKHAVCSCVTALRFRVATRTRHRKACKIFFVCPVLLDLVDIAGMNMWVGMPSVVSFMWSCSSHGWCHRCRYV